MLRGTPSHLAPPSETPASPIPIRTLSSLQPGRPTCTVPRIQPQREEGAAQPRGEGQTDRPRAPAERRPGRSVKHSSLPSSGPVCAQVGGGGRETGRTGHSGWLPCSSEATICVNRKNRPLPPTAPHPQPFPPFRSGHAATLSPLRVPESQQSFRSS